MHGRYPGYFADLQGQSMKLGGDEIILATDFNTYAKAAKACIAAFISMDEARQAMEHEINCILHMIRLNPKLNECVEGLRQSPNGLDRALADILSQKMRFANENAPIKPDSTTHAHRYDKECGESSSRWLSRVAIKLRNTLFRAGQEHLPPQNLSVPPSKNIPTEQAVATSDLSSRIALAAEASRRLDARASKAAVSTYRHAKEAAEAAQKFWKVVAIQSAGQARNIDKSIQCALSTLKEALAHAPTEVDLTWAQAIVENVENLEAAKAEVAVELNGVRQKLDQDRLPPTRTSAPGVKAGTHHEQQMSGLLRHPASQSSPTIAL